MKRIPRFLRSRSKSPGRQSPRPMSPCRSFSERLSRRDLNLNSQRFHSTRPSAKPQVQVPAVDFLDQVVDNPKEFKKICDAIPKEEHPGTVMFSIIEICDNPREGRDRNIPAFLNSAAFVLTVLRYKPNSIPGIPSERELGASTVPREVASRLRKWRGFQAFR